MVWLLSHVVVTFHVLTSARNKGSIKCWSHPVIHRIGYLCGTCVVLVCNTRQRLCVPSIAELVSSHRVYVLQTGDSVQHNDTAQTGEGRYLSSDPQPEADKQCCCSSDASQYPTSKYPRHTHSSRCVGQHTKDVANYRTAMMAPNKRTHAETMTKHATATTLTPAGQQSRAPHSHPRRSRPRPDPRPFRGRACDASSPRSAPRLRPGDTPSPSPKTGEHGSRPKRR